MVDGMTGTMGVTAVPQTTSSGGLGVMDGDAFLQLMVAQLRYQNPFEPMDSSQMLQQTAALATVETLKELAGSQRALMGLQQATMAAGLIGQQVTAITLEGEEISGVVESINFTVDGPLLTIAGEEVPIGNVTELNPKSTP